jgi:hypothetical protein
MPDAAPIGANQRRTAVHSTNVTPHRTMSNHLVRTHMPGGLLIRWRKRELGDYLRGTRAVSATLRLNFAGCGVENPNDARRVRRMELISPDRLWRLRGRVRRVCGRSSIPVNNDRTAKKK